MPPGPIWLLVVSHVSDKSETGRTSSHPSGWTQVPIHSPALATQMLSVSQAWFLNLMGRAGPLPTCRAEAHFWENISQKN